MVLRECWNLRTGFPRRLARGFGFAPVRTGSEPAGGFFVMTFVIDGGPGMDGMRTTVATASLELRNPARFTMGSHRTMQGPAP